MDKAPFILSSSIRTSSSDKLLRTFSITRMYNSLTGLFTDRTKIDTSLRRFIKVKDNYIEHKKFNDCLHLNDERTIEWDKNMANKISGGVLVNKLELNPQNNMFIPFEDGDSND